MKLKKVIIPLVVTIFCCMYYAAFAIICAAGKISETGKTLGLVIPGIVVLISIFLFVYNYIAIRHEADELEKRETKEREQQE